MKRVRRTKAQWQELIKTFEASGLRAVDFCGQHDIDPKYFSKKKIEYGFKPKHNNDFVKVQVENSALNVGILLSIKHSNCSIDFYQLPDVEYLSQLMSTMR